MKKVIAALLCLSLVSPALAAPLPSGKPAGLHQAQLDMNNGLLLVAAAAIVAVAVAIASSGGNSPAVATSSGVTS